MIPARTVDSPRLRKSRAVSPDEELRSRVELVTTRIVNTQDSIERLFRFPSR